MRQMLLGGLATFVAVTSAIEPPPDAAEPAVSGDVLVLNGAIFDETLETYQYNLVKFYAPWCSHCKEMKGPYEEAAKELKENGFETVALSEVDATLDENKELAEKYGIQGFPTLKWFNNQIRDKEGAIIAEEYTEARTQEGFKKFVEKSMKPSLNVVESQEELDKVIAERDLAGALYVFTGDADVEALAGGLADKLRSTGGSSYFFKGATKGLTVYRGQKESKAYEGSFDKTEDGEKALMEWCQAERVPHFGQITEENYEIYIEKAKKGMFWVCFDPENKEAELEKYSSSFVEAATTQEYPFVWIDAKEFEQHAKEELGCDKFPSIVLQRGDLLAEAEEAKVDQFIRKFDEKPDTLNTAAIKQFFDDITSGELQPVPEPDELDGMDDDDLEDADEEEIDEEDLGEEEGEPEEPADREEL